MISRKCDVCDIEIKTERYLEITVRELVVEQAVENQDTKNQAYGDFCNRCIKNGNAMKNLIKSVNEQSSEHYDI